MAGLSLAIHKPDSVPILLTEGGAKSRILSEVEGYSSLEKTRNARFCNYLR